MLKNQALRTISHQQHLKIVNKEYDNFIDVFITM